MQEELGVIDGKKFSQYPKWEGKGLPLRANCDLDNPRQKFLWMFTAMPGVKGAPLMLPTEYYELVSWRLCVLGAGITGDPQLKYQASGDIMNPWNAAGKWVSADEPDPPRKTLAESIEALPAADKAEIKNYVLDKMGIGNEQPEIPMGQYRISDLAKRLNVTTERVIAMLKDFGLNVKPDSLVGRDVTDRVLHHLGLDQ